MSDASSFPDPPDRPARYSAQFTRQFASRQYRPLQHLIRTRLEVLFRDVYRAARAERLRARYRGLRSARIDDRVRIIYRLCEECRRDAEQHLRPLDCCLTGSTEEGTVNVLCLSAHYGDIPEDFAF